MTVGNRTPTDLLATGVGVANSTFTPTATDGDQFTNDGKTFFEVINGSAGSINVTVDAYPSGNPQGAPAGLTVTDPVTAVAAGVTKKFGPFPKRIFDGADEKVKFTCSAVADVLAGIYRMPRSG